MASASPLPGTKTTILKLFKDPYISPDKQKILPSYFDDELGTDVYIDGLTHMYIKNNEVMVILQSKQDAYQPTLQPIFPGKFPGTFTPTFQPTFQPTFPGTFTPTFTPKCKERNVNFITDHIAIGDFESATKKSSKQIQEQHITHILNVSTQQHKTVIEGIIYMNTPFYDSPEAHLISKLHDTLNFIHTAVSQGGKVLVHCQAGISRSVSIVIAYLMWSEKKSFDKILEHVKSKRQCADPNDNFRAQLLIFEDVITKNKDADLTEVCKNALELYPNPPNEEGKNLYATKIKAIFTKQNEQLQKYREMQRSKNSVTSGGYKKQQKRKTRKTRKTRKH